MSNRSNDIESFFTGREATIVIGTTPVGYVSDINIRITQDTAQYLPLGTSFPIIKPTTQVVRFTMRAAYWDSRLVALVTGADDGESSTDADGWVEQEASNMDKNIKYRYKNASIVVTINVPNAAGNEGSTTEITRTITLSELVPTSWNIRIVGTEIIEENVEGLARRYEFKNAVNTGA